MAEIVSKYKAAGGGCLVQLVGFIACFIAFPVGLFIGIALLVVGGRMARYPACGNCGNRLEDRDVRICPVCRATLD